MLQKSYLDKNQNKKFTSSIKRRMFRGYQKIQNKSQENVYNSGPFMTIKTNLNVPKYPFINQQQPTNSSISFKDFDLSEKSIKNKQLHNNIHLKNNKNKNEDLGKLLYTTSLFSKNLSSPKMHNKHINLNIRNNNYKKSIDKLLFVNPKTGGDHEEILSKLFPEREEINKYSYLPFVSLVKSRNPYNKIQFGVANNFNKDSSAQEDFLFKISHSKKENKKMENNFNKNKGIKKGAVFNFSHQKNFEDQSLNEKNLKNKTRVRLQLDINNLSKGEKTAQISTTEKHILAIENNLREIKLIPNELFKNLESDVFKFIDEDFNESKNLKTEKNENDIDKNDNSKNSSKQVDNIISLNDQVKFSNTFLTENKNYTKYCEELFRKTSKPPLKYPINFYPTQQIKKKEHFNINHKNTFEERRKKLKENKTNYGNNYSKLSSDNSKFLNTFQGLKKNISTTFDNENQKKILLTNALAFNKENKIRDVIIGRQLKCEFSPVDIKRVLNGLKPWVDCNLDKEEKVINKEDIVFKEYSLKDGFKFKKDLNKKNAKS